MAIRDGAPYGTWRSAITAGIIASRLEEPIIVDILIDRAVSKVYTIEKRPSEGDRSVIVSVDGASRVDVFDRSWDARCPISEYEGPSAAVHEGTVFFSSAADNRVYKVRSGGDPQTVTPENEDWRFINLSVHPVHSTWLVGILQDRHGAEAFGSSVEAKIALIDTINGEVVSLLQGGKSYSRPQFNPDGCLLAWQQWNHTNASWDGCEILIAKCTYSTNNMQGASMMEPLWTSLNELVFMCDRDGYLNPWMARINSETQIAAKPLLQKVILEDFGHPGGGSSYTLFDNDRILCTSFNYGHAQLYLVSLIQKTELVESVINLRYATIQSIRSVEAGKTVFLGERTDEVGTLIEVTLQNIKFHRARARFSGSQEPQVVTIAPKFNPQDKFNTFEFPSTLLSSPQPIVLTVPTDNRAIHLIYYAPENPGYVGGLTREIPPVIVQVNCSPTRMAEQGFDLTKQYFTSRGWAWVDLNASGSWGYGRAYRERIRGNWGVLDVQDTVECIRQLGERGLVDATRVSLRGDNVGSLTILASLATASDKFASATLYPGTPHFNRRQSDLGALEQSYLQALTGVTDEAWGKWKEVKTPSLVLWDTAETNPTKFSEVQSILETIQKTNENMRVLELDWRQKRDVQKALEEELQFYVNLFGIKS